ncbi:MAG TPA: polysaccharide deacetylase family protein [Gemmatimonadales bacterium]|nr:polysaccharide deacetylase family protein [Gemmatimonadales bacterium]
MASRPEIASLMYHEVTDDAATTGFQRPGALAYKHSTAAFTEHLRRIDAAAVVKPGRVVDVDFAQPGRHLLITFDDGGKSALFAADLLARHGWTGHFFIVTSLIGSRTFLNAEGVRALRSGGHIVGSHSHTHPMIFRSQAPAKMAEEWRTSCDILGQILGEPCVSAAVPGGDISEEVLESASGAGLRYLFTSEPWLVPRRVGECWILGRYSVKITTSPARIESLVRFQSWTRALWRRRLKVLATRIAPPLYRMYIRARST